MYSIDPNDYVDTFFIGLNFFVIPSKYFVLKEPLKYSLFLMNKELFKLPFKLLSVLGVFIFKHLSIYISIYYILKVH